jgi:hypothetical protein
MEAVNPIPRRPFEPRVTLQHAPDLLDALPPPSEALGLRVLPESAEIFRDIM